MPDEDDKDRKNLKIGINNADIDINKGNSTSDSSKTTTTTTSFIEESCKLKTEENNSSRELVNKQPAATKDCKNENEKGTTCSEIQNNNRNGFNNSFHERVLVNNTSLVTL